MGNMILNLNATWPFASVRVDDSALILSCFGARWTFVKSSIRRLSKFPGLFSVGLRIEHNIEGYAGLIVFWTFQFARLQRELEQRGYIVS